MLTKKDLEHLAELARIDLKAGEEGKLLKDLGAILDYFKELQSVNTDGVAPMTGGTEFKNVLREDAAGGTDDTGKGSDAFPDKQGSYLRVPPVF
ncbi:MAG: Asp-tRNA(Asn)/Glu-tRNA(Gln) amidotransferase subunit GatC [Candidatus Harrisonbacteria bacterium]|nr:Asp-tRNA(Asn)/Glu-tRNA(Gln) amidotransferase subunit GatC [Candidatus Harrisonbacteria bacterium]